METTTCGTGTAHARAAETAGVQIIRPDASALRRAMAAVRPMMAPADGYARGGVPGCRIRSRPGGNSLEVLGTDGRRALMIDVDTPPVRAGFDRTLPREAVRQIARARPGEPVSIEMRETTLRITTGGNEREHEEADCIQSSTFDRIAKTDDGLEHTAVATGIRRTEALAKVRALPNTSERVCRIDPGVRALLLRATDRRSIGPGYAAEAILRASSMVCRESVPVGIRRAELVDTLRTMRARTIDVRLGAGKGRIWFVSADRTERFIVAAARLY